MSTISDFGIPGVSGGILQPKLKNRWRVTFAGIGGGVDSQPISAQAITVTRPSLSFEEIQLDRYNSRAYIAGKHTFEPCTITFEDDLTGTATSVIQAQQQIQQQLIGVQGPFLAAAPEGSLYKFATILDQMDGGTTQVVEQWILDGCWLQNVEYGDLDYAASEVVIITLNIRYDLARQSITGYTGAGQALGGVGPNNA